VVSLLEIRNKGVSVFNTYGGGGFFVGVGRGAGGLTLWGRGMWGVGGVGIVGGGGGGSGVVRGGFFFGGGGVGVVRGCGGFWGGGVGVRVGGRLRIFPPF